MAKCLTEDDIRRIFREEAERDKRIEETSHEAKSVVKRIKYSDFPTGTGGWATSSTRLEDVSWTPFIQKVIDTYWEVVEEECNE